MASVAGDDYEFHVVGSIGLSGGHIILWKPEVFRVHVMSGVYRYASVVSQTVVEVISYSNAFN